MIWIKRVLGDDLNPQKLSLGVVSHTCPYMCKYGELVKKRNLKMEFRSVKLQEIQDSEEIVSVNVCIQKNPVRSGAMHCRYGYSDYSYDQST